jgi:carbamoyl-phosphate synthase large subunit
MECEADAISDGTHAFMPAVMEHIELAGIHSGDSACIIPSMHISEENLKTIETYTKRIAEEMHVKGLMNIQYAIENGKVFVIEANPRASRTVPLVSKVCNIRMVPLATEIATMDITGRPSPVPALKHENIPYYGVKEAVFPFNMFPEVDPILGPEMRSTGEVLGISEHFGEAFVKAQEATQTRLPLEGTVLISVNNKDKSEVVDIAKTFEEAGFNILATGGTADKLAENGIKCEKIFKLREGRPNITDAITNGQINLILNTASGRESADDDSYIRKAAIRSKIPYMTTMAAGRATAEGILYVKKNGGESSIESLQGWHNRIGK